MRNRALRLRVQPSRSAPKQHHRCRAFAARAAAAGLLGSVLLLVSPGAVGATTPTPTPPVKLQQGVVLTWPYPPYAVQGKAKVPVIVHVAQPVVISAPAPGAAEPSVDSSGATELALTGVNPVPTAIAGAVLLELGLLITTATRSKDRAR